MVDRCFKPYCNWTLWHFTLCISLVCMRLTPLFYPLRWHQPENDVASSVRVQTRFERRGVSVCQERVRLQSLHNQLYSRLIYSLSFHTETRVQRPLKCYHLGLNVCLCAEFVIFGILNLFWSKTGFASLVFLFTRNWNTELSCKILFQFQGISMFFFVSTETSLTAPLGHPSLYLFMSRIHTNSWQFGIFVKYVKIHGFYFVPPEGDWSEFYILTLELFLLSEGNQNSWKSTFLLFRWLFYTCSDLIWL